ncbi:MAG: carboxyl transferase domain-containing protein [Alphaproteobacteria bacterium]|nr:carboxyl transferase domain-containing protein [Alphaproteobacteria bacterium]
MPVFRTRFLRTSEDAARNRVAGEQALATLRALEERTRLASAKAGPRFAKRGQLLPRERLGLLLDPGAPFVELSTLAGYLFDKPDPDKSVPGGGLVIGIGYVGGVRALVVADDSGIDAGALQPYGLEKMQRAQDIAFFNKLPFIHLIESAGANLLQYRVEDFVRGGKNFYNLCRHSAAGLPVLAVTHGSSTAGGAYMTGLSDMVVMVRGRAKAFLAGPPLLKAATGEIATDEDLGGADMHGLVSGLAEHIAEDDAHGIAILREHCAKMAWSRDLDAVPDGPAPLCDPEDLIALMPADGKKPVDMREVVARIVDGSDFLEFKAAYGPGTLCIDADLMGMPIGIITNNAPIDPGGATKATQFIQICAQTQKPILYLQNTTGYIVGTAAERAGMIKHGSKMIQAVANAGVPQVTIICGASFGAGNYGMCGKGFGPDFSFSWPTARIAVMGAEQAATTMAIVMEDGAKARGQEPNRAEIDKLYAAVVETFEKQQSALHHSARVLDDGVIDPRDTRKVVAFCLSLARAAAARNLNPLSFGVARP